MDRNTALFPKGCKSFDNLGQLLSAVGDQSYNYTYTYDSAGNILTANGHTYTYGNANWKDLLTAFDGQSITYDASGNPLSYYNGTRWTFTWKNGRSLATATDGTTSISYTYDSDGLRTSKKVGNVTHNYFYAGGQLLREAYGNNVLDFCYDSNGYPYALKYNGTTYYYITNLQGDVMYLVDGAGETVASYAYDPYGNILSATGPMAEINPLRYRGYYYDAELEMYYLRSRYYDPMVGRFINADEMAYLGAGGNHLGYNLFTYCENNPILNIDETGTVSVNSVLNTIKSIVNTIRNKLWDYIVNLITFDSATGTLSISTGLISTAIEVLIAVAIRGAIKFVVTRGMKTVLKIEKVRNTFIESLFTFLTAEKGIGKQIFDTVMGLGMTLAGVPGVGKPIVSALVSGCLSNILQFKSRFLQRGASLVSSLSSIGGILALFMDISDGKWDDKFSIKVAKVRPMYL